MTDTDPGRGSRGSRLLAPGDGLRRWWSGLSRVQKWVFGVLGFGLLALTPLFPPPFFNTPGISFGGTMAQFAIAWCLINQKVSTVITGASSVKQVHENMKALDFVEKFTPDVVASIKRILKPVQ